MSQCKKLSNRINRLRSQVMERQGSFIDNLNPYLLDIAIWKSEKPGRSAVQKRAAFLYEEVKLAPVEIPGIWQLAGEHLPLASLGGAAFQKKLDKTQRKRLDEFGFSKKEMREIKKAVKQKAISREDISSVGDVNEECLAGKGDWGTAESCVFWGRGWVENHSIRDYDKVLRMGFAGIRKEIEEKLQNSDISDPDFSRKENFWKAGVMTCDAGILLGERYAELAEKCLKKAKSKEEKARYAKMMETCRKIPANGAETFFEATQSLWFAHILTCGEDNINANSIGRIDQFLYPYYQADIKSGKITREQAIEIMEELACKLYLDYDVQAMTLGGVNAVGKDAVNELSSVILEATDKVDFIRDLSVRLHDKSPKAFIDQCSEMIIKGGGIPFIFNDECLIQALADRGISTEHARDYAPIGCIELTIPGKANPHAVSGWINSTKCLELAIFGGFDPLSGKQVGPRTPALTEIKSYEEFFSCYCQQLEFFSRNMVYHCNRGELMQREKGPLPCWSILTDDCIERGRDITDEGAIYNYHSICFLGTADTADSLIVLKKLVFESDIIDRQTMLDALKNNYQGYDKIRQLVLNEAPKYGNDQPEVDEIAAQIDNHFIDYMDTFSTPLGGKYFVHLFSFLCNISFGKATGATPDGRYSEEPLAYSLSAHQGRDEKGITAMLNSLAKLPHHKAAGSSAAIVDLSPKLIEGEAGKERLSHIIKSLIKMRVGQIQFNVVTAERLVQAQEDPENYGNISVRVAGYSQMFKLISRDLQNHIIARTKHEE